MFFAALVAEGMDNVFLNVLRQSKHENTTGATRSGANFSFQIIHAIQKKYGYVRLR